MWSTTSPETVVTTANKCSQVRDSTNYIIPVPRLALRRLAMVGLELREKINRMEIEFGAAGFTSRVGGDLVVGLKKWFTLASG